MLEKAGSVSVAELSKVFQISEVTIRRDLTRMAEEGLLCRIHGGAIPNKSTSFEPPLSVRAQKNVEEKARIAQAAANLVNDGEVVLLNDGSTTAQVAQKLTSKKNLTIVTNALNIANQLVGIADLRLILLGGLYRAVTDTFVGPLVLQSLSQIRADKLFLGVDGFSLKHGISSPNFLETEVNRAMIESAGTVIVVADHSKFGNDTLYQIAPIGKIHMVISDDGIPREYVEELTRLGVKVV
ncbi:MAG: DeoR/GlpR family DNA-binding transcription regulator, partial [Firmicutes bacterium]|nr:DeoR/GlpR family DNA-binding transcription regulator [Bacillota bacterium]